MDSAITCIRAVEMSQFEVSIVTGWWMCPRAKIVLFKSLLATAFTGKRLVFDTLDWVEINLLLVDIFRAISERIVIVLLCQ